RIARCGGCYPSFAGVPLPLNYFFWGVLGEAKPPRFGLEERQGGDGALRLFPPYETTTKRRNPKRETESQAPPLTFISSKPVSPCRSSRSRVARGAMAHGNDAGSRNRAPGPGQGGAKTDRLRVQKRPRECGVREAIVKLTIITKLTMISLA